MDPKKAAPAFEDAERRRQLEKIRLQRRAREEKTLPTLNMSLEKIPMAGTVDGHNARLADVDSQIDMAADQMLDEMFGDDEEKKVGSRPVARPPVASLTTSTFFNILFESRSSGVAPELHEDEQQQGVDGCDEVEDEWVEPEVEMIAQEEVQERRQQWKAGEQCEAVWLEDEVFYVAEVIGYDASRDVYEVLFCEYGNRQPDTPAAMLRPLSSEEKLMELGLLSDSRLNADAIGAQDWSGLMERVFKQLSVRDCEVGGEVYRRVFDGCAAVTWMVDREGDLVRSRQDALLVYQRMLRENLIAPVLQRSDKRIVTHFTDGGMLFMLLKPNSSNSSPPSSPGKLLRHNTLAELKEFLQEELEEASPELIDSEDDVNNEEEDDIFIATIVMERKQTLLALPPAKRMEQEAQFKRLQSRPEVHQAKRADVVSPRLRNNNVGGGITWTNSSTSSEKVENRKSNTAPRPPSLARPQIPDFSAPLVPAPLRPAPPPSPVQTRRDNKPGSNNASPNQSPRSPKGQRPVASLRSPLSSPRSVEPASSPRPMASIAVPRESSSSPRPVTSPRAPPSPPRRKLADQPLMSQSQSSLPNLSPRLPPLPTNLAGSLSLPAGSKQPSSRPLASPRAANNNSNSNNINISNNMNNINNNTTNTVVSPRSDGRPPPPPPSFLPRDPFAVGRGSPMPPRNNQSAAAVSRVVLPRQVAYGHGTNLPHIQQPRQQHQHLQQQQHHQQQHQQHHQQHQQQQPFLGAAVIGQSFVAQRAEQLSVVAGTTVMVLARPTKNWLVISVGASVGAIPVGCVRYFTPSHRRDAQDFAAGRGAGRGGATRW